MKICPCNSSILYTKCCEPFIAGEQFPPTPEALMRSRYTAYTMANVDYIADTMQGPAAMDFDKEHTKHWAEQIKWHGLKVIRSEQNQDQGIVEFIAKYSYQGNNEVIYEVSEFHKINDRWYYIDGKIPKIGRNEDCPCGSQKKYKKCCGN